VTDNADVIRAGRTYVRLIEAAGLLADWEDDDHSRRKWQRVRRSAQEGLRKLAAALPAHVTGEILAASEKALGTARDVGLN
jgi:hypothetical protein